MSAVLKYVGLNPNEVINGNDTGKSIKTVGELQKAIEQAKKHKVNVKTEIKPNKSSNTTTKSSNEKIALNSYDDDTPTSSQRCYNRVTPDSYTLEFSCVGQYRHGQWVGVTGLDVDISGDGSVYSYRITKRNDLSANYTSSRITMHHDIEVKEYVGVGKWSVPVNTNTVKGYSYYNIEDWV
ncbi:hypothetical protein CLPUN_10260 [Clostridium puniceum]|uniref:Uncharacterized protein n=1 Tax=Clostridium puniceum TaxID=29367 RepID=A0A1S8TW96_9CLOT|nr:hypothetical protein [Clostridium puniceum]OOM81645.1 hypothetical protein CLPUN_10260 [Clostridium puniceum]